MANFQTISDYNSVQLTYCPTSMISNLCNTLNVLLIRLKLFALFMLAECFKKSLVPLNSLDSPWEIAVAGPTIYVDAEFI